MNACTRSCSSVLDCSNNAASVTGTTRAVKNGAECKCVCRNSWFGQHCTSCPPSIDPLKDCNACKTGYDTFPKCYLTCTNRDNCNNHALKVVGNSKTGCTCSCLNQWYASG